jgi:hypothetical protein
VSNYRLDVFTLHRYLDHQRQQRGLSWRAVAAETGCPPSLFTKLGQDGGGLSADALMTLLHWLGRTRDLGPFLTADDSPPTP